MEMDRESHGIGMYNHHNHPDREIHMGIIAIDLGANLTGDHQTPRNGIGVNILLDHPIGQMNNRIRTRGTTGDRHIRGTDTRHVGDSVSGARENFRGEELGTTPNGITPVTGVPADIVSAGDRVAGGSGQPMTREKRRSVSGKGAKMLPPRGHP